MLLLSFSISLYRNFRSEVVQIAPPILIHLFGDDFYKGREQVLGFGFSYIVPKSTPLRVRRDVQLH